MKDNNKNDKELILQYMKYLDNLYLKAHDYELFMVALCLWLRIDEYLVKKINKRDLEKIKKDIFNMSTLLNDTIVGTLDDLEYKYKDEKNER